MAANGRLPRSVLAPIAGGYLRKDAARRWNAMNARSRARYNVTILPMGSMSSYRTYAQQVYLYGVSRPGWAARPGTSNHGWGLAVDLKTRGMRSIVDAIGSPYGWAKRWSDASWEWWHLKWAGFGKTTTLRDRWAGYTASEKRWIQEYDRLYRAKRDRSRRRVLRRYMKRQRKRIWRAAQKTGWNRYNRRRRYRSLYARTS